MKLLVFCACLCLLFSCKNKNGQAAAGPAAPSSHDSIAVSPDSGRLVYIKRAFFDLKNYIISVQTRFLLPDTLTEDSSAYVRGNFLVVFDKSRHRADTLLLEAPDYSPTDLEIQDVSDSLHFKTLVLNIGWRGDSDMDTNEFIEYNNKLTELFSIDELESLQRVDEQGFAGFISSRDELVENIQHDYPFTVSLKDHQVHVENPSKQYIGFLTTALTAIKGYRVSAQNDTIAYTIRKGTTIRVDTLYRLQGLVRLIVSDSIVVRAATRNLTNKLQHNSAG